MSPTRNVRFSAAGRRAAFARRLALLVAAVFVALIAGTVGRAQQQATPQPGSDAISAGALAQIDALLREKNSRTPAQQKLDSQLVYAVKMARGETIAAGVTLRPLVSPARDANNAVIDNRVVVDARANVGPGLLQQLGAMGVDIVASSAESGSLRLQANLDQLEAIAALPEVIFIQPKQKALTSRVMSAPQTAAADRWNAVERPRATPRKRLDREKLRAAVLGAINGPGTNVAVGTGQGSRESEGDTTHRAFSARGTFHADGTGVKIGVLSDSACNIAASQALGDLGPVTVLPGQTGDCTQAGDEGTAMLEIIHDLAPGAQLYFATAFSGITEFADNIRALRSAGCDIIVDDIFYFSETPFQDGQALSVNSTTNGGVVIQAVKDVTASGAMYFSSAGNEGNIDAGTSGTWEGDFADGGPVAAPINSPGSRLHSFGPQNYDVLSVTGGNANVLFWSDPLGGSSNDYDLFLLNSTGTAVLASSTDIQNGTQDPFEIMDPGVAGNRIVIVKTATAAARFLHLGTIRGVLGTAATAGETHGHSAVNSANSFGVAATPARGPFGNTPPGPYPNAFNSGNVVESFSSNGPRRIFFNNDATPITPGNVSSTGGMVLSKPDITAADGVAVTGVGGFPSPFYGTSAAAPHAAAIAALVKSSNLALTAAQVSAALVSTAIDIQAPGPDRDSGAGIIMAYPAVQAVTAMAGTAFLAADTIVASENPGNGDGSITVGEGAKIVVPLINLGVAGATAITATLTTATPGVSLTLPATSTYPNLAVGASASNTATPFLFTLTNAATCPLIANFTLTLTYTGGPSQVINFSIQTGPTFTISTTLDGVAPTPSGGVTTVTGLQTSRLSRDGILGSCAAPKANPGLLAGGTGTRQYDAYTFNTCPGSVASCANVTVTQPGITLYSAAYTPSFVPGNPSTNFKADPGQSSTAMAYSFPVTAGVGAFVVVAHEVNQGGGIGTPYTLTVTNACAGTCATPNNVPVAIARNVTVVAGISGTANASINNGSFDADADALTITQSPPGPYPIGVTSVRLTVTDTKGATSQATANVTVITARRGGDLDGDGKGDLLLRSKSSGQNIGWLMNGLTVTTSGFMPTIADTNWEIRGRGDFDGDGKADIILRNKATGQDIGWLMNGLTVSTSAFMPTIADTNWEIKGVADLDGDGRADVILRNKFNGQDIGWLMNGLTVATSAFMPTIADTNWDIVGVGDLNGDGKADVILRNKFNGQNIGWLMNGLTVTTSAFLPTIADTNWEIKAVGDLDGDGKADVVLRNKATGQDIGWLMNGLTVTLSAFMPTIADTNWDIKGAGDVDGDGKADIILRNKVTGQNIGWLMNGLTVSTSAFMPTIADTNWDFVGQGQ